MRTLGMEMEKAGFIQEMVADALPQDDVEAEADEEIDKGKSSTMLQLLFFPGHLYNEMCSSL
jgi:hypothetical protein